MREREILITPFVNAQGYNANKREELTDNGEYYDINRDFPYNRPDGDNKWYSTVGARATSQIFRNNLLVGALSFHAGMEAIGYPWGSYNHAMRSYTDTLHSTETPDDTMFSEIADVLQEQSSSRDFRILPVGEMTDLIYPWYGSLDDWAYASGWDTAPNGRAEYWNPSTYSPYVNDDYFTNIDIVRSSLYIVEASNNKDPPFEDYGRRGDLFWQDWNTEGYIPMHMRLVISYIDTIQPYTVISYPTFHSDSNTLRVSWKLNGCLTIDQMAIETLLPEDPDFTSYNLLEGEQGYWNWEGQQTHFQHDISVPEDFSEVEILFRIRFRADQNFAHQNNPDPNMGPKTYLNNLRLIDDYTEEINGKKITNVPRLYSIILTRTGKKFVKFDYWI